MAVKRWDGTQWVLQAGNSNKITYQGTSPSIPSAGDVWVDSSTDITTFDGSVQSGNRNFIINGGFAIDQRNNGASHTITAGTPAYTLDRWYASCTGANLTGVRSITLNQPDKYAYQINGATSNTGFAIGQRIETGSCYNFGESNATLSVRLLGVGITSVTWTAYYANSADSFGTLSSPTRTQIATGTFTGLTASFAKFSATFSVPNGGKNGIEIVFSASALTSGQVFVMTAVQLEKGTSATPFEYRPIGQELALCQRYYWRSENDSYLGVVVNTGIFDFRIDFPVEMRARPLENNNITAIILTISPTATQVNVYNGAFTTAPTSYGGGATMSSKKGGIIRFSGGAGGINGFAGRLLCGTSVYFDFDAEL